MKRGHLSLMIYGLVLFAPLAVGTVSHWSTAIVSAAALATLIVFLRETPERVALPVMALALAGIALVTLIQALPVPSGLVSALSPVAFDAQTRAAEMRSVPAASLMPLSLDRYATWGELGRLLGYLAVFVVAANHFARDDQRARELNVVITGACVVTALVQLGHWLLTGSMTFPFVNPNHFAGFTGLGATLSAVMALTTKHRWRAAFGGAALFLGVALVLAASRGAVLALAVTGALIALFAEQRRRYRKHRHAANVWRRLALGATAALVIALGLGRWHDGSKFYGELHALAAGTTPLGKEAKIATWREDAALVRDFAWTGVGRGAYASVHARYKHQPEQIVFTHAENEYLQAWADWGIAGVAFVLALILSMLLAIPRLHRDDLLFAAWAPLAFLGLHNVVDFNLETGGVAVPATLLLGVLCARAFAVKRTAAPAPMLRLAVASFACAVVGLGVSATYALPADTLRLEQRIGQLASLSEDLAGGELGATVERHPHDYFLAQRIAGTYAKRGALDETLEWTGRTLELNPTHQPAHWLAARTLRALGAEDDALLAYRMAASYGPPSAVLEDVLTGFNGVDAWAKAVPDDPSARDTLVRMVFAKGLAIEAAALLDRWPASSPLTVADLRLRASIEKALGHDAKALELSEQALSLDPSDAASAQALVERALARQDFTTAERLALGLKEAGQPGSAHFLLGRVQEARGKLGLALQQYRIAESLAPNDTQHTAAVSRMIQEMNNAQ